MDPDRPHQSDSAVGACCEAPTALGSGGGSVVKVFKMC